MSTTQATTVEAATCSSCGVTFTVPRDQLRREQMHAPLALKAGWMMKRRNADGCWTWHCQRHSQGEAAPGSSVACISCGNQITSDADLDQMRELGFHGYLHAHGWEQHPVNSAGWVCPAHGAPSPAPAPSSEQVDNGPVTPAWTSVICATCGRITFPPNPDLADVWLTNAGWRRDGPGHWICDRHDPAPPAAPEIKGLAPAGWACKDCGAIGLYGALDVAEHWCTHGDVVTLRKFFRAEAKQQHPQSTTQAVLAEVAAERRHQDAKWGLQTHNPVEWVSVETEELGEAAMEANKMHWGTDEEDVRRHRVQLRAEWLQVAAVAVAAVECLDRQNS